MSDWTLDHDAAGYPCAICGPGGLRLHIVPGTTKNAESVPVVLKQLNEAARLRALVEAAYREGFAAARFGSRKVPSECWPHSDACAALNAEDA